MEATFCILVVNRPSWTKRPDAGRSESPTSALFVGGAVSKRWRYLISDEDIFFKLKYIADASTKWNIPSRDANEHLPEHLSEHCLNAAKVLKEHFSTVLNHVAPTCRSWDDKIYYMSVVSNCLKIKRADWFQLSTEYQQLMDSQVQRAGVGPTKTRRNYFS
jgi:hypothetical protein